MKNKSPRIVALHMLGRREHTSREIAAKLKRVGFGGDEIAEVCRELREQGFLCDDRVVDQLLTTAIHDTRTGGRLLRNRLLRRGVESDAALQAVERYSLETQNDDKATALALSLLAKGKDREFVERYLWRRGFSSEEIKRAIRSLRDCQLDIGCP